MLRNKLLVMGMALVMSMCAIPVPAVTRQPSTIELKNHKVLVCMSDDGVTCIENYMSDPMTVGHYVALAGFKHYYEVVVKKVSEQPFNFYIYIEVGN